MGNRGGGGGEFVVECRKCGAGGLSWKEVEGKWRLFSGDKGHLCVQKCKYCGAGGMVWTETPKGWRLASMQDGKVHRCIKPGGGMPAVGGEAPREDGMPF